MKIRLHNDIIAQVGIGVFIDRHRVRWYTGGPFFQVAAAQAVSRTWQVLLEFDRL
jgi:hypothetical protein